MRKAVMAIWPRKPVEAEKPPDKWIQEEEAHKIRLQQPQPQARERLNQLAMGLDMKRLL